MPYMHLKNAEIILEENKTRYEVGDYIHGRLIISLNGELSLSCVKIGLICLVKLEDEETAGSFTKEGKVYFKNSTYLEDTYELPPEISGKVVRQGTYEIPFKFQLPKSGIPPSFESDYGCINYFIEYIIEENDEIHKSGTEIIVEAPFRDNLMLSVGGSTEKDLGLLCFGSGKVFIDATVPKKGYLAGESIEMVCTVINSSTVSVTPRATFYQTQIFMSGERHKTFETSLTEPITGSIVNPESTKQEIITLQIPKDIPLSMKSSIITVKYFIHVTLDIPHTIDLHINLPVVITNKYALNNDS